jgi:hypothetical protein
MLKTELKGSDTAENTEALSLNYNLIFTGEYINEKVDCFIIMKLN